MTALWFDTAAPPGFTTLGFDITAPCFDGMRVLLSDIAAPSLDITAPGVDIMRALASTSPRAASASPGEQARLS